MKRMIKLGLVFSLLVSQLQAVSIDVEPTVYAQENVDKRLLKHLKIKKKPIPSVVGPAILGTIGTLLMVRGGQVCLEFLQTNWENVITEVMKENVTRVKAEETANRYKMICGVTIGICFVVSVICLGFTMKKLNHRAKIQKKQEQRKKAKKAYLLARQQQAA